MISHLIPAAGIAGLIKAALALHHKVLPPTLHCEEPNPELGLERSPFYINTETRPWIHGGPTPRRAGVNAFGFGGINAHAILEERVAPPQSGAGSLQRRWDHEVFVFQAESRKALIRRARDVRAWLSKAGPVELKDLAATVNTGLDTPGARLSVVAASPEDLERKLDHALTRLEDPGCPRIKERQGVYFFQDQLHPRAS